MITQVYIVEEVAKRKAQQFSEATQATCMQGLLGIKLDIDGAILESQLIPFFDS